MEEDKTIELRSEKVRNIVGKVPPMLLRIGITIISIIIFIVLILAYCIPYPQYYISDIEITTIPRYETILAPNKGIYYSNSEKQEIGILQTKDTIYNIKIENGKKTIALNDSFFVHKNDIIALAIPDSIVLVAGICKIPPELISNIHHDQKVNISLSSGKEYVGSVSEIGKIINKDSISSMPYYTINIKINIDSTVDYTKLVNSVGKARILLSEKPILKNILHIN